MVAANGADEGALDVWRARVTDAGGVASPLTADGRTFFLTHYADFADGGAGEAIRRSHNPVCIVLSVDAQIPFLNSLRQRARAAAPNAQWIETPFSSATKLLADSDHAAGGSDTKKSMVERTWEDVRDVFGD